MVITTMAIHLMGPRDMAMVGMVAVDMVTGIVTEVMADMGEGMVTVPGGIAMGLPLRRPRVW